MQRENQAEQFHRLRWWGLELKEIKEPVFSVQNFRYNQERKPWGSSEGSFKFQPNIAQGMHVKLGKEQLEHPLKLTWGLKSFVFYQLKGKN